MTNREKWEVVKSILSDGWHQPDTEAVQIQLAAIAAHFLSNYPPAWVMAVAPSGSAKTVTLDAMKGLNDYFPIDQITAQTFLSGKFSDDAAEFGKGRARHLKRLAEKCAAAKENRNGRRPDSPSLLHRIGTSGIIGISDFSAVLELHETVRNSIFSQLRLIYDGSYSREFGHAENLQDRAWNGRITCLVAITPEIDRFSKVFATLGDRFIRVRWPRASGVDAMISATRQTNALKEILRNRVHDLVLPFMDGDHEPPEIPDDLISRIGNLSEIVCLARTYIPRDRNGDIEHEPYPESNTRLPQQLCQIARGWSALMGSERVGEPEFQLVYRCAMDSMPPARRHVLERLRDGKPIYSGFPSQRAVKVAVDDLAEMGLIEQGQSAKLSAEVSGIFWRAMGAKAKLVSFSQNHATTG